MWVGWLFARICDKYDISISQFEWELIQSKTLGERVTLKLRHESRPTLVFSEVVDGYTMDKMASTFESLLHQCCAALDIHLVEK